MGKHPQETTILDSIPGYVPLVIVSVIGLSIGWAMYSNHRRNAPIRKDKAQRQFFITAMKKIVETMTAHIEWEGQHGSYHRQNGAAYQSGWVDLGLAVHGNDGWQLRYTPGEAKPECLNDSEWEQFTALIVKFGRKEANESYVVWVTRYHEDGSYEIQPYDNNRKPVNPTAAILV